MRIIVNSPWAAIFFIAASTLSITAAFNPFPPARSIVTQRKVPSSTDLFLSVSATDHDNQCLSSGTKAMLRSIDKQIDQMERKRAKYSSTVKECERLQESFERKKYFYMKNIELGNISSETCVLTETTVRSVVKAFAWRFIASGVTLAASLQFSGSLKTALSIVGSDFFSKAATMVVAERIMNMSSTGRENGSDDISRSLAKALIWRLFAICNTLAVSCFISKNMTMASKIAVFDAMFKTGLMFAYERFWAKIDWGKHYNLDLYCGLKPKKQRTWQMLQVLHMYILRRKTRQLLPKISTALNAL